MRRRFAAGRVARGIALLVLLLSGCVAATPPADTSPAVSGPAVTGKVTVYAASSLTDAFRAIAASFQQAHPGTTVEFNFGASSALAAQLEQAAPADVFASADAATMQRAVDRALIDGSPVTFARNLPVVVVPADNRAGIATPKDLAKAGVKIVLAGPEVPIGNYARQIIDRLAADPAYGAAFREATLKNIVSNEANVRAILTKVELGEADAGVVYRTDALASGARVRTVAVPDSTNVIASYPIAVVRAAKNRAAAAAFIAFVRGVEGQRILKAAGFDAAS